MYNGSTASEIYYNGDKNSTGVGSYSGTTGEQSVTALTGEQVADGKYYANSTIEQVLADRVAAAEAAQAAAEAAAQAAAEAAAQAAAEAAAQAAAEAAAKMEASASAGGEVAQALADTEPGVFAFSSIAGPVSPLANLLDQSIAIRERQFSLDVEEVGVGGRYFQLNNEQEDKE
jgi:hypothetical protein